MAAIATNLLIRRWYTSATRWGKDDAALYRDEERVAEGGALQPTMLSRWQARSTVPGHCTSRGNNSSTADEPLKCR